MSWGPGTIAGVEYQALYRKYRPQTFEDVIGQAHVTATLAREVVEGRVAHAYLFAGPRGTGKTTTARILAKALNCAELAPDGSPCNRCESCVAITEGHSMDVLELDAASHNSVEDIRDIRVSVSTVASSGGARRVFILDEAHMLSKAAGNALLKTLEEPPEHVHFVLATTEPYKLLDTIRSRAQRFDFHAVPAEVLAAHLSRIGDAEGYETEPAALVAVARHALGSVRDSLSLLEQVAALGNGKVTVEGVSRALGLAGADATGRLVEAIAERDAKTALELVATLASQGVDLRRFASESVRFFRGVFLAHYAPNLAEVADEPEEVLEAWTSAAARLPAPEVLRAVDLLGEALIRLREGREERLMLELALIRLTRPETDSGADALLARLERLERMVAAGVPPSPSPSRIEAPPAQPPQIEDLLAEAAGTSPTPRVEEPATPSSPSVPEDRGGVEPHGGREEAAAETPGAAADPPEAPAPVTDLTLARVQEVWPQLFGTLRDVLGARRWAFFREATPGAVAGDTVVLDVKHEFHLESLQRDEAIGKIVSTRLGDLLGGAVKVRFRRTDADPTPVVDLSEERSPEKDTLLEAPVDVTDPVRLVADELGAEIVEEVTTEE